MDTILLINDIHPCNVSQTAKRIIDLLSILAYISKFNISSIISNRIPNVGESIVPRLIQEKNSIVNCIKKKII